MTKSGGTIPPLQILGGGTCPRGLRPCILINFIDASRYFLLRRMERRRGLAMKILSVRPSVKRVICDKTKE